MTDPREQDDLFLETLASDERLAWMLASATAAPVPPRVRESIVAQHRRRPFAWIPRVAFAAVAAAVLLVTLASATGSRVVTLDAAAGAPGGGAVVAVLGSSGYMVMALPSAPSGRAYEAWVIRGSEPLPAGVADGRGVLPLQVRELRQGDVIAITVEDARGATRPTSAPILIGRL